MKKDGIQTRNRKLAAKVKKRRMHDFFKPPQDPRFGYGGIGSNWNLTNQMSQYYASANQMAGQMASQFMPAMHVMSGASSMQDPSDPLGLQQHHHHQATSGSSFSPSLHSSGQSMASSHDYSSSTTCDGTTASTSGLAATSVSSSSSNSGNLSSMVGASA